MSQVLQIIQQEKVCAACGEEKPVSEFYLRKDRLGQYTSYCKPCLVIHKRKSNRALDSHEQVIPTEQKCSECKEVKLISDFQKCSHLKTGHLKYCKSCMGDYGRKRFEKIMNDAEKRVEYKNGQRKKYLKNDGKKKAYSRFVNKKYGVTVEYIERVLKVQLGMCANRGCGKEVSLDVPVGASNRAVIDHCHATGKFRAVLCQKCNLALGHLEENCNRALGLVEYINQHKEA